MLLLVVAAMFVVEPFVVEPQWLLSAGGNSELRWNALKYVVSDADV